MDTIALLSSRLRAVEERIAGAAERAGRSPGAVTLVAVSKTHPPESILELLGLGQRVFGENRVQEAADKIPQVPGAAWHLVGRLQRNKARKASELFDLIHSLDSLRLATILDRIGSERGVPIRALIEVDLAGEEAKGGVPAADLPRFLDQLTGLSGLEIRGLMAIPPFFEDPQEARPYFRRLAALARREVEAARPGIGLQELSMGMSGDFEVAIEEGATIVRVGTAIFGTRR